MTQTIPNTPSAGEQPEYREEFSLPDQPPDFALAPANPERPVRIHFVTHITMGGVDIYRL